MPIIVSGGQTGVDRAALDAALEAGVPCRGWCPDRRIAEDGVIPSRYPLRELAGGGYDERTRCNVRDSDGTLVLRDGGRSPGTDLTEATAEKLGRPLLVIYADSTPWRDAVRQAREFVLEEEIGILNVAGPRASESAAAYRYARQVVSGLLEAGRVRATNGWARA